MSELQSLYYAHIAKMARALEEARNHRECLAWVNHDIQGCNQCPAYCGVCAVYHMKEVNNIYDEETQNR